jgi:hypothetical protein
MSAMQKAIRRGHEDLALSAAATLLRDTPDKLWRRIGCIAYEDVGVASLDSVGLTTVALGGKQVRAALGGDSQAASSQNFAEFRSAGRPTISSWPASFTQPTPWPAPSCQT